MRPAAIAAALAACTGEPDVEPELRVIDVAVLDAATGAGVDVTCTLPDGDLDARPGRCRFERAATELPGEAWSARLEADGYVPLVVLAEPFWPDPTIHEVQPVIVMWDRARWDAVVGGVGVVVNGVGRSRPDPACGIPSVPPGSSVAWLGPDELPDPARSGPHPARGGALVTGPDLIGGSLSIDDAPPVVVPALDEAMGWATFPTDTPCDG